jgi:hypothetical protein
MRGRAWLGGISAAIVCASVLAAPAMADPFVQTTNRSEAFGQARTGDFNKDGKADIASVYGSSLKILLGNGDGTFADPATYSTGSPVRDFVVADVNADTNPDVVIGIEGDQQGSGGQIAVMPGAANGTFGLPTKVADAGYILDMVVADFNGDGDPDLAVATPTVKVLTGDVGVTFTDRGYTELGGAALAVGDFNADGDPDLVSAGNAQIDADVAIVLGTGSTAATFGTYTPLGASGGPANTIAVADTNGDNDPDIIVPHTVNGTTVSVFPGSTGGTFATPTSSDVPFDMDFQSKIAIGDFNGDHDPDFAMDSNASGVKTMLGSSGTSFGAGPSAGQSYSTGLATADLNGDGLDDFVKAFGSAFDFPNDDPDQGLVEYGLLEVFTSHVPAKPTQLATTPASPAKNTHPAVTGTADAGTTVKLYTNSNCTGSPAATGTAANFASPGLSVTVPNASTTSFYATAADTFGTSKCSTSFVTYHDTSPTLNVSADTHPEPTRPVPFTVSGVAGATSMIFYLATAVDNSCGSSYAAQQPQSQAYGADQNVPAGPFSINRDGPSGPVRLCAYLYESNGMNVQGPADAVASAVLTNGEYGDSDGDGVLNNVDVCPFNAGPASSGTSPPGCPAQPTFDYSNGGYPGGSPAGGYPTAPLSNFDEGEQISEDPVDKITYVVPTKASLKKFLKTRTLGSLACFCSSLSVKLTIPKALMKKLHLKSATISTLKYPELEGKAPLTFKLSKTLKAKLSKAGKFVVSMQATLKDSSGKTTKLPTKKTILSK